MKATEFRLGNLAREVTHSKNEVVKVSVRHYENIEQNEIDLFPVPLTEEWLLKFGFKKEEGKESKHHGNFYSISHFDSNFCFAYADFRNDWGFYNEYTDSPFPEDEDKKRIISCGIKHVHQLQNLYHALTGEELTAQ